MPRELHTILKLRVPVIVRLGHKRMATDDVLALGPGAIIELPQPSDNPLDLMVNNKVIGQGAAVKIGENFGIRVTGIGDKSQRLNALATTDQTPDTPDTPTPESPESPDTPDESPDAPNAPNNE